MKTQKNKPTQFQFIFQLILKTVYDILKFLLLVLQWTIKKTDQLVVERTQKWNEKFIDIIYKRAVQTFDYNQQ